MYAMQAKTRTQTVTADVERKEQVDNPIVQAKMKSVTEFLKPNQPNMFQSIQRREMKQDASVEQQTPNRTGLPNQLKKGIEHLSGCNMDGVRVHFNSSKPAQLQALAYTQGTDIHVAPGQEQHLPHEAWHVVQQMQGRVFPMTQMRGTAVNNDPVLEHEADVMGRKANHIKTGECFCSGNTQAANHKKYALQRKAVQFAGKKYHITINMAGSGNKRLHENDNKSGDDDKALLNRHIIGGRDLIGSKIMNEASYQYEIQGPRTAGGTFDWGNSINDTSEYIKNEIVRLVENGENEVNIEIKGHSRGAVSVSFILYKIKKLSEEIKKHIHFISSVQYDPVPGQTISLANMETSPYYKHEMNEFKPQKSMVVYSLYTQYGNEQWGTTVNSFVPQAVYGTDIVILDATNHSCGLDEGKEFKDINIEKGVYYRKEDQSLVRIANKSAYEKDYMPQIKGFRMRKAEEGAKKTTYMFGWFRSQSAKTTANYDYQQKRYDVIDKVVNDWFERNEQK